MLKLSLLGSGVRVWLWPRLGPVKTVHLPSRGEIGTGCPLTPIRHPPHNLKMARHFLAALALVHGAAALHNGFEHLALKADVAAPPDLANFVADLGDAAAADGEGSNACQTADAAVRSCYLAGALEATGGFGDARDCVCCHSKTALATAYGSCASYLHEVLPNEKTAYVGRFCRSGADPRGIYIDGPFHSRFRNL